MLVDAYGVATGSIALQWLQAIASRNREILKPGSGVEQLQLPLRTSPEVTRDAPGETCIPVAEQIRRGLISERVNHTLYILHE